MCLALNQIQQKRLGLVDLGIKRVSLVSCGHAEFTNKHWMARSRTGFRALAFETHKVLPLPPSYKNKSLHLLESLNQHWRGHLASIPSREEFLFKEEHHFCLPAFDEVFSGAGGSLLTGSSFVGCFSSE